MTEYTERKTDLIDKSTAKAAGLNITPEGVELYGDKVKVKNGNKTAAMFQDGKLNADLIDADTINVHHVWAKDKNNKNTVAYFGNYDITEAQDYEKRSYPLWVGSSTVKDAPFRVGKDGRMYADEGAFGVRYYEDPETGETTKYGRFEITKSGIQTGDIFKEDSMWLTDTNFYLIKKDGDDGVRFSSHGGLLPLPGIGSYLNARARIDAIGKPTSATGSCNVCYYADARNGVQNYALYGNGDISIDGSVYAYKATRIEMTTKNVFLDNLNLFKKSTYHESQAIDSLTIIVNSKAELALTLPTRETIWQLLFGGMKGGKFCVRMTIIVDIGSASINLRGRCLATDQAGVKQWNYVNYPLITHWDGGYWSDFWIAAGDSCDFLLTYDPNKSYTLEGFTQPYLARVINKQY